LDLYHLESPEETCSEFSELAKSVNFDNWQTVDNFRHQIVNEENSADCFAHGSEEGLRIQFIEIIS